MKLLGINDDITVCDCCGKRNLKCTVALEMDGGDVVHYGRDCAAAALIGRKSKGNAEVIELQARARARVAPVIDAIRAALPLGVDAAKAAGKAMLQNGNVWWDNTGKEYHDMRVGNRKGMTVSISGWASCGCINVHWTGGSERIDLPT